MCTRGSSKGSFINYICISVPGLGTSPRQISSKFGNAYFLLITVSNHATIWETLPTPMSDLCRNFGTFPPLLECLDCYIYRVLHSKRSTMGNFIAIAAAPEVTYVSIAKVDSSSIYGLNHWFSSGATTKARSSSKVERF